MQKLKKVQITVRKISSCCFRSILIPMLENGTLIEPVSCGVEHTMISSVVKSLCSHLAIVDLYLDANNEIEMINVLFSFVSSINIEKVEYNEDLDLVFKVLISEDK